MWLRQTPLNDRRVLVIGAWLVIGVWFVNSAWCVIGAWLVNGAWFVIDARLFIGARLVGKGDRLGCLLKRPFGWELAGWRMLEAWCYRTRRFGTARR